MSVIGSVVVEVSCNDVGVEGSQRLSKSPAWWLGLLMVVSACSGPVVQHVDPALVGDTGGDLLLFPDSGNGGYEVSLYDLKLILSDDLTGLEGVASITATATQDLQRFSLDARDLMVASVSVDGKSVEFVTAGPELIVTLGEPLTSGDEFTVTVDYQAEPVPYQVIGPGGVPASIGWVVTPGRLLLAHGFPGAGATWTPISESFDDPARFIFRIKAPEGFTATASGFPIDDEEFFVWDTQREVGFSTMPTFSVAQYKTSVVEWNGIPIEFALSPDSFKRAIWERDVPEMLDFLETIFGPFPWERLGFSAINGKQFALSTPMRILIPESFSRRILVHELAHQWAGVAVGSTTETNVWLWEGLATYTESLFAEHEGQNVITSSLTLLSRVPDETRPLDQVDSIDDLLDNATYQRGALLYHALRLEIGDEAFFTTLREFIQRNLHGTAEVEDLRAVAEEISGQDLAEFFTAWVTQPLVPDLPSN